MRADKCVGAGLQSVAGVSPLKGWPSSHSCARGELVGIERVLAAPAGVSGFLAPGGRRAGRGGQDQSGRRWEGAREGAQGDFDFLTSLPRNS